MKKNIEMLSEWLAVLIAFLVCFIFLNYLNMHIEISRIASFIIFLICYFIIMFLHIVSMQASASLAFQKKYKMSIILILPFFLINISYSIKFIKMIFTFIKGDNIEKNQKYFNDCNQRIQYVSLCLYGNNYDTEPVIKWFEDNYISKNLPVESYFYPIYKLLTDPDAEKEFPYFS